MAAQRCAFLLPLVLSIAEVASRGFLSRRNTTLKYIPTTLVLMPPDYEDYTRGRTPLTLFPKNAIPGLRVPMGAPGPGLPSYSPGISTEVFMDAKPTDPTGHQCAPGGDAAGHYFYNVDNPDVVPYVLDKNDPSNTGAAVVVAPGGGNIHLAWEPEGISLAEWLNTIGVSAFVLKYRVPDFTGKLQLMDAQRAMSLVRSKAEEYGIDPKRIGLMGSSAGGSLALAVQNSAGRAYDAIDVVDEVSYKPDFLILNYPGTDPLRDLVTENVRNMPPTTFGYAEDDPCIPSLLQHLLQNMMESHSTSPHLIMDFPEGRHGWDSCDYYPQLRGMEVCGWKNRVETFLKENYIL
mmetsp:Transcript_92389/g.198026  ORF Transcript_92389/g.198026 Transcript_92389/m.198026 type:complete len:348 (+) Transcript_92389:71-1114(+)